MENFVCSTLLFMAFLVVNCYALGVNWGNQATHSLPPKTIVKMLLDNGFTKVKLFEPDYHALRALANTGIEITVGAPNEMFSTFAASPKAASNWVKYNISQHANKYGALIRNIALGNEPLLQEYDGAYLGAILPALTNIQSALVKAHLDKQVKVTVPLNADIHTTSNGLPSGGEFREDVRDLVLQILKYLSDSGAPVMINIHPFITLYKDSNFPLEYAFFDGKSPHLNDDGRVYSNMLDASLDTLVWALRKNGFLNLPIVVGEIGWPTDGDRRANLSYAQRFNQGLISHLGTGQGTPMRPEPVEAFMFSFLDEDLKSIQPGNFERHWGLFYFDGSAKYQINLGTTSLGYLVPAKGVVYEKSLWCVLKSSVSADDVRIPDAVSYACQGGDCTSLGYGTSCGSLDVEGNVSYAFNSYFQINDQEDEACNFNGLGVITKADPSRGSCRFPIMIEPFLSGSRKMFQTVGIRLLLGAILLSVATII